MVAQPFNWQMEELMLLSLVGEAVEQHAFRCTARAFQVRTLLLFSDALIALLFHCWMT